MKTIVVVVVVPSENVAEGLVRPVYRADGRGGRETHRGFKRRSAGVLIGGRRPFRARLPPTSG
jgi:hypothetical protein